LGEQHFLFNRSWGGGEKGHAPHGGPQKKKGGKKDWGGAGHLKSNKLDYTITRKPGTVEEVGPPRWPVRGADDPGTLCAPQKESDGLGGDQGMKKEQNNRPKPGPGRESPRPFRWRSRVPYHRKRPFPQTKRRGRPSTTRPEGWGGGLVRIGLRPKKTGTKPSESLTRRWIKNHRGIEEEDLPSASEKKRGTQRKVCTHPSKGTECLWEGGPDFV